MQTVEFLNVGRWITKQYSPETKKFLFERGFMEALHSNKGERPGSMLSAVMAFALDAARVQLRLAARPHAVEILSAFGLGALVDPGFPEQISEVAVSNADNPRGINEAIYSTLIEIQYKWDRFSATLEPLAKLTTPDPVLNQTDFDDILTVEVRSALDIASSLDNVLVVLQNVQDLYGAICRMMSLTPAPLSMIYAASGSPLRFDFRGLGEPIKQLKELWVESWRMIRHRDAEDLVANNRASLTTLATVRQISELVTEGKLTEEEGSNLRERILRSTHQLFDSGALPREVPHNEDVPNIQLIEARQQKLLGGPSSTPTTSAPKQSPAGKTRKRRKLTKGENPPTDA